MPLAWRKKWARDWDAVKFCSERARGGRRGRSRGGVGQARKMRPGQEGRDQVPRHRQVRQVREPGAKSALSEVAWVKGAVRQWSFNCC